MLLAGGEWRRTSNGTDELTSTLFFNRLTHEIVLPLWKSPVSLALMVDKKAKRCEP